MESLGRKMPFRTGLLVHLLSWVGPLCLQGISIIIAAILSSQCVPINFNLTPKLSLSDLFSFRFVNVYNSVHVCIHLLDVYMYVCVCAYVCVNTFSILSHLLQRLACIIFNHAQTKEPGLPSESLMGL